MNNPDRRQTVREKGKKLNPRLPLKKRVGVYGLIRSKVEAQEAQAGFAAIPKGLKVNNPDRRQTVREKGKKLNPRLPLKKRVGGQAFGIDTLEG
jgi:hypothetical protein